MILNACVLRIPSFFPLLLERERERKKNKKRICKDNYSYL